MRMADSKGLLGANPLELISAALGALPQSSLLAMMALSEKRTSGIVGLASAPLTPKLASEGPMARTTTVWAPEPLMTKPPIITSKPVRTWPRVEIFARCAVVSNAAVTLFAASIVTRHAPIPLHAPLQPANADPSAAAANSPTAAAGAEFTVQVAPQSIPAGLEVTVPLPVPDFVTDIAYTVGVTLTEAEAAPVPAALVALTLHAYAVPLARLVTVMGEAAPVA